MRIVLLLLLLLLRSHGIHLSCAVEGMMMMIGGWMIHFQPNAGPPAHARYCASLSPPSHHQ